MINNISTKFFIIGIIIVVLSTNAEAIPIKAQITQGVCFDQLIDCKNIVIPIPGEGTFKVDIENPNTEKIVIKKVDTLFKTTEGFKWDKDLDFINGPSEFADNSIEGKSRKAYDWTYSVSDNAPDTAYNVSLYIYYEFTDADINKKEGCDQQVSRMCERLVDPAIILIKEKCKNTPKSDDPITITPIKSIELTFTKVTECGNTIVIRYYNNPRSALPTDYKDIRFYDILTTATYEGNVKVKILKGEINPGEFKQKKLDHTKTKIFHFESGDWQDVGGGNGLDTLTAEVSTLSPFAVAALPSIPQGTIPFPEGGSISKCGENAYCHSYPTNSTIKGSTFPSGSFGIIILGVCLLTISIFALRIKMRKKIK